MTAPRDDGGLKLIDIRKKDYAIKIQWIKRIKENREIANLAYHFLPNVGEIIWKCNLKDIHLKDISTYDGFWLDVFKSLDQGKL